MLDKLFSFLLLEQKLTKPIYLSKYHSPFCCVYNKFPVLFLSKMKVPPIQIFEKVLSCIINPTCLDQVLIRDGYWVSLLILCLFTNLLVDRSDLFACFIIFPYTSFVISPWNAAIAIYMCTDYLDWFILIKILHLFSWTQSSITISITHFRFELARFSTISSKI